MDWRESAPMRGRKIYIMIICIIILLAVGAWLVYANVFEEEETPKGTLVWEEPAVQSYLCMDSQAMAGGMV